jgi:hypothetical protein
MATTRPVRCSRHAANRSIDEPDLVTVYHQAESFDTLRSFLANPEF